MAITTYAELQTAVANWIHRSDLTTYIPDFITLGETRIMREVRTKDMETALSDTISSGVISLPTGYLELKSAYLNTAPTTILKRQTVEFIYQKYPTRTVGGRPAYIAREGSSLIFGPYPDSDYTVQGIYYQNIGPVSSSAHALFTNNPDLYLWAALAETEPFLKNDPRVQLWEQKYMNAKNLVNGLDDRENASGSVPQMKVAGVTVT